MTLLIVSIARALMVLIPILTANIILIVLPSANMKHTNGKARVVSHGSLHSSEEEIHLCDPTFIMLTPN